MECNVPNGSKLRRLTNIGSVRMSCMYGICCTPFLFAKPLVKNTFFQILSQKNRSDCECQKFGFGFDPKNPPSILWIHDPFLDLPKKTQNPFLNSEIRIWIFPKKRTRRG